MTPRQPRPNRTGRLGHTSTAIVGAFLALAVALVGAARAQATTEADSWHARTQARLSAALERYEAIAEAGGWPTVPAGPTLKPGMVDARVAAARERLEATGDAASSTTDPMTFDPALEAGVRIFQARHGLEADGLVGRKTLAALNVPVETRVKALRINLARIRAFKPWGPSYLLVIVPGFEAYFVRDHRTILDTRVVVGEPDWPTPGINGMMTRLEINPYWNVPRSILIKEMIPRLRRDPGYLERENIRVFNGWGSGARELDRATIDWTKGEARAYRLRQDPGPENALGSLKFTFNNKHSIYLHDTSAKSLFNRSERALSHGCVRVHKPFDLAVLLLEGNDGWDAAKLESAISSGRNRTLALERAHPVHLVYWTAWADEDGRAQFRNDVYKLDGGPYARQDDRQHESLTKESTL